MWGDALVRLEMESEQAKACMRIEACDIPGGNRLPVAVTHPPLVMLVASVCTSERESLLLLRLRHHRGRSDGAEAPPQPRSFLLC